MKRNKEKEEEQKNDAGESAGADVDDVEAVTASSNAEVAKSFKHEDPETGDMIHTPQFHHPHHPHHRSFQVRTTLISFARRGLAHQCLSLAARRRSR